MTAARILLVEDDESFGYILKEYLCLHGYQVHWLKNGNQAIKDIRSDKFDLCILDIMLPGADGFEVSEAIRESGDATPFIFLTAKSLKVDKLKGFKKGCDDYEVKPVDEELLLAKIRAILNRTRAKVKSSDKEIHTIGAYRFDAANHTLIYHEDRKILTEKETMLIKILFDNKNLMVERKYILKEVWGVADLFTRKSMDVFITRLRKYFNRDPSIRIINIHSKGFIFQVPDVKG